jgi:hypothetical protein
MNIHKETASVELRGRQRIREERKCEFTGVVVGRVQDSYCID